MIPRRPLPILALLLAACAGGPPDAATRLLATYKSADTPVGRVAGETGEAIDCPDRHAVCADLWLARAEALLALAAPGVPADRRAARARGAVAASIRAEASLPPGGRADLALRGLKVRAAAGQGLRDLASDPAATAAAEADLRRTAAALDAVPGGRPYAAWFATEAAMAATLRTVAAADVPCPLLGGFRAGLPPDPPADIAGPVRRTATVLDALIADRGCRP